MSRVLVAYASTHGHTAKVAARVAAALRQEGVGVDVRDVASAPETRLADYDGVVVGASVHGGHHQREIVRWAERHATTLNLMPTAFLSVCLSAADDSDESRQATRDYVDDFEEDTGWTPGRTESVAGALQYREYDFPTRLVMRLLMHHGGHPSDITRDYDYTDWDALDGFGRECAAMVARGEIMGRARRDG